MILPAKGPFHNSIVLAGTLAPVGEKRKREPFGPGQKIANKMLNSFVYTTSEQKHPACVKGIEAYKNVSEQHMKVIRRRWSYELHCGFDTSNCIECAPSRTSLREREFYVVQDVQDILLGTWNAIKHTKDGKSKYGAEEGSELPYNGKLAKVLSRKFGELRKEHEKKASAAAASAGSAASLLTVAEDDAENVPSNAQEVAPQE